MTGDQHDTTFHVRDNSAPNLIERTSLYGDFKGSPANLVCPILSFQGDVQRKFQCVCALPIHETLSSSNFSNHGGWEAFEGVIDLTAEDGHAVARIPRPMYNGNYDDGKI